MPRIIRFEGTAGGLGIARDLWPEDAQYVHNIIQTGMPVGDDDYNLMQQVAEYNLRRLVTGLATDGVMTGGSFVFTSALAPPIANVFYLQGTYWLLGNFPLYTADSRNQAGTLALQSAIRITLDAPPSGSTARTDLVFLEFWFEEVASSGQTNASTSVHERGGEANQTVSNDILNVYLATEVSRRVQARWRIRVVDGATALAGQTAWGAVNPNSASGLTYALLPGSSCVYRAGAQDGTETISAKGTLASANTLGTVNGFSYAVQIASVNRNPNVTTVFPTDLLAGPVLAQLNLQVPRANIFPPLPDPLPGEDRYPEVILYEGTTADSTAGSGTTEQVCATQNLATTFTLSRPSGVAGSSVALTRIDLQLAQRGTQSLGSDLLVQIVNDASGSPAGSVVASFTMPKEWLTPLARWISIPFNIAVNWGTKYWVLVAKAGDASGYVAWIGEPSTQPNQVRSRAGTSTWTAIADLHMAVVVDNPNGAPFTSNSFSLPAIPGGVPGGVRNTIAGAAPAQDVTGIEYDATGIVYLMHAAFTANGAIAAANLVQIGKNPVTGSILSQTQLNVR